VKTRELFTGLKEDTIKKGLLRRSAAKWSARAKATMKIIEAEHGKVSPGVKKQSKEYALEVLGDAKYASWLNIYSAIAGEFKEGWIPPEYYAQVVLPHMNGLYGKMEHLEPLTAKLWNTGRSPDIAYCANGLFFTPAWEVLPNEALEKYIFEHGPKVVRKQDGVGKGAGVHILTKETFDIDKVRKMGNGVFQKYIRQHEFFARFMPDSVATLRVFTVVEDSGKTSARYAALAIGRSGDAHIKKGSFVTVPVNCQTGEFYGNGMLAPEGRFVDRHPDTHVEFSGKVIPRFREMIVWCEKTHRTMPACRTIGWDVILDKNDEIQLIEWEGWGGINRFIEAIYGPCFADLGWEKLWKNKRDYSLESKHYT